jgi:hypothetical protein
MIPDRDYYLTIVLELYLKSMNSHRLTQIKNFSLWPAAQKKELFATD